MALNQEEFLRRAGYQSHAGEKSPLHQVEVDRLRIVRYIFTQPLDLRGARFVGPIHFVECTFVGSARFQGASFEGGATFFDCDFKAEADFSWAVFSGRCYFWRTQFDGPANFENCVVGPSSANLHGDAPYLLPGESNFSWTRFSGPASFFRMQFGGPSWFWRPVFLADTTFDEAKFAEAVQFYGAAHEVCIGRRDLQNPIVFDLLLEQRVLVADPETFPTRYAHFDSVHSVGDLKGRLEGCHLGQSEISDLSGIWLRTAVPTFPNDRATSFKSVTFAHPERSVFSHLGLGHCLFAGTGVEQLDFSDVTWRRRSMFLGGRRWATYDESAAPKQEYGTVQRLYGQLEANYYKRGSYREASDFRYGKMEILRRSQFRGLRNISVLAGYKYLSGYGERYGLALTLLLAFVFVLFPGLYAALGVEGGAVGAVVHSLEISTFLQASGTSATLAHRFVEGIERLVVPLQAGLFVLAVNRRLGRA